MVDDFSSNRDLHRLLLEREGVQVFTASSGQEAIDAVKSRNAGYFDFILMDVAMPEMNGFVATNAIWEWENKNERKKTDIYFVSGEYVDDKDLLAAFQLNAGAINAQGIQCIRKPVDLITLRATVQRYKDLIA